MPAFERPKILDFPQTFATFTARDKSNSKTVEYRITDLPESRFEEALELFVKHFLPDEPMCSSKNIPNSSSGVKAFCDFWIEAFGQRLSLACFKGDDLVGVNCLVVNTKDAEEEAKDYKDRDVQDIFDAVGYSMDEAKIFEKYAVDRYLAAYGLVVHPSYRGRNIATEMIRAREPLMRKIEVDVTATAFTATGSQKAAQKAGFEDLFVISYEQFRGIDPRFDFVKTKERHYKVMALKIPLETRSKRH